MAVTAVHRKTKIKLYLNAGLDLDNKQVIKYQTLDKFRPGLDNETLLNIANEVASLQEYILKDVVKLDEHTLIEE